MPYKMMNNIIPPWSFEVILNQKAARILKAVDQDHRDVIGRTKQLPRLQACHWSYKAVDLNHRLVIGRQSG